jgi:hypothetical protein
MMKIPARFGLEALGYEFASFPHRISHPVQSLANMGQL